MSQVDRGVKRRCGSCEAPFYDMLRYPIRCPKCGAEFDAAAGKKKLASVPRPPKTRTPRGGKPVPPTAVPNAPEPEQQATPEEGNGTEADSDESDAEDLVDGDDSEDPGDEDAQEDDGDDNVTGDH